MIDSARNETAIEIRLRLDPGSGAGSSRHLARTLALACAADADFFLIAAAKAAGYSKVEGVPEVSFRYGGGDWRQLS